MDWKTPSEYAAVGFVGYGAASLAFSPSVLHFSLTALSGALVGVGHVYLRRLPWKAYIKWLYPWATAKSRKAACVSVSRKLHFREVSTKTPEGVGFIRVEGLDKKELFAKLNGKAIDQATVPYHIRVLLEQGKQVEIPWEAIEPHLKAAQ